MLKVQTGHLSKQYRALLRSNYVVCYLICRQRKGDGCCYDSPFPLPGRNVRLSLPPKGGGQSWCILHHVKKRDQPPLESLACVNHECPSYGQAGQADQGRIRWIREGRVRWTRKSYGPDQIRYQGRIRWIRCLSCQSEFSERKNTP